MIKYRKYLLKLKDAFLEENVQNTKMLDLYLKYLEGEASEQDLENANKQLAEILKSLGTVSYTHLTLPTTLVV